MTVTFDNNILLSATLWDNSISQKLLFSLIRQDIKIYSSPEILSDYQKVLKRDFSYKDEEIAEIMKYVLSFLSIVVPEKKEKIVKKDPDDDMIIACAVESKSEYIFTYDKHLLELKEYNGIKIIRPEEARAIF
jgi:uncharacterized protein